MTLRKASNEERKSEKGTKVRYLLPIVSGFYCVESVTVLLAFCLNRRPNPHSRCSVRKLRRFNTRDHCISCETRRPLQSHRQCRLDEAIRADGPNPGIRF